MSAQPQPRSIWVHALLMTCPAWGFASAALAMSDAGTSETRVEAGVSLALAQERAARITDLRYALSLRIPHESNVPLKGNVTITFTLSSSEQPLQLDFRQAPEHLGPVRGRDGEIDYRVENEHLVIPAGALRVGANTLQVAFSAPQDSVNRNPDYLFTLFVPDRARSAFPLFDQPDLKARFSLRLEVPGSWTALSNGALLEDKTTAPGAPGTGESDDYRGFEFAETRPIPSYLFSFVAGEFERVSRTVNGRPMTLLHRETDKQKLARNLDDIFALHGSALSWLEAYTGIDYPFGKFDFALIPDFPYGGMEHVGAIQYRASSLLLEADPADTQLLNRAQLIAHETAHMWFGNLVTMRWFDDVWTKEVFANFMADKIVNPEFPDIDHELNFLVSHYPQAYSVDRSAGANAIRQALPNLNQAGQLYGPIIYHKAPIMMRQLELLLGARAFQTGIRQYLSDHAYGNADWPGLISILDKHTATTLTDWSAVWVTTPGMTELSRRRAAAKDHDSLGYGRLPVVRDDFGTWTTLSPLQRGALLINRFENVLAGAGDNAEEYFGHLSDVLTTEANPLLLEVAADQLRYVYFSLLAREQRQSRTLELESMLWERMLSEAAPEKVKLFFELYVALALSESAMENLSAVWDGSRAVPRLSLAEAERISLAELIAVRSPARAPKIVAAQLAQIENPDRRRRFDFVAPALSPRQEVRDRFFSSLASAENRSTEVWVTGALRRLHDPTRIDTSLRYLPETLALLEDIQVTGDIFFPSAWLTGSLASHRSAEAAAIVEEFLESNPDYPGQLRMKILQAADPLLRAVELAAPSVAASSATPATE